MSFVDAFDSIYRIPHFLSKLLLRSTKLQRVRCVLIGHNTDSPHHVSETKQLLNTIRDPRFSYAVLDDFDDALKVHVLHLKGQLSIWDLRPEGLKCTAACGGRWRTIAKHGACMALKISALRRAL